MILNLPFRSRRSHTGFTLIELMIAVVVLAIVVALALPSFLGSIRKGRRSEAFTALSAIQQAQERYRSNNAAYAATLATLGLSSPSGPGGYYSLSISSPSATGYEVSAAAVAGTSQASDGNCAKLSVKADRGEIKVASCNACASFTYAATDACWSR